MSSVLPGRRLSSGKGSHGVKSCFAACTGLLAGNGVAVVQVRMLGPRDRGNMRGLKLIGLRVGCCCVLHYTLA